MSIMLEVKKFINSEYIGQFVDIELPIEAPAPKPEKKEKKPRKNKARKGRRDYDDYDDFDCDCCDDDCDCDDIYYEVTCPTCGEVINLQEDVLLCGETSCPKCGEALEFDFSDIMDDCGCGCGCDHDHDEE